MKKSNKNDNQIRLDFKFVIITIIIIIGIITFIVFSYKNNKTKGNNISKIANQHNTQNIINADEGEVDMKVREQISAFNSRYELFEGGREGEMVISYLDKIMELNKENGQHIVEVLYNGNTTSTGDEIMRIKENISEAEIYEIVLGYDEEGYVNLVKIISK